LLIINSITFKIQKKMTVTYSLKVYSDIYLTGSCIFHYKTPKQALLAHIRALKTDTFSKIEILEVKKIDIETLISKIN